MKRLRSVVLGVAAILLLALSAGPARADTSIPGQVRSGTNINMCLDVGAFSLADRAAILHFECNGAANQVFHLEFLGLVNWKGSAFHSFKIVSNWSGKCLDVLHGDTKSGSRVVQFTCNGERSQQWLAGPNPLNLSFANFLINGKTISGLFDNPRCLDVPGATTGRAQMQIWSCNNTAAQRFHLPFWSA